MRSVQRKNLFNQVIINDNFIKDDKIVTRKLNESLIIDLIQKYSNPNLTGGWHCPTVHTFDTAAQKLLLSQILSAEDYEFYTKDNLMTHCAINEFKDDLNSLIQKFYPIFLKLTSNNLSSDSYKDKLRFDTTDTRSNPYDVDPIDGSYRWCYE